MLKVYDKFGPANSSVGKLLDSSNINWDEDPPSSGSGNYIGEQNNASASSTITVTIPNFERKVGTIISVRFKFNVPYLATLKVNDTDACAIWYRGSGIPNNTIGMGDTAMLQYDGNHYVVVGTNRISKYQTVYSKCSTPTATSAKVISVASDYILNYGSVLIVKFENAVNSSACTLTLVDGQGNQVMSPKTIAYQGSTTDLPISAGDTVTLAFDATYYQITAINATDTPDNLPVLDSDNYIDLDALDDDTIPTSIVARIIADDVAKQISISATANSGISITHTNYTKSWSIGLGAASSSMQGGVKLSTYSTITTDISNSDDTKAVTPKALPAFFDSKIWIGTQAQYDALSSYDANKLYFIKETAQS